MGFGPFEYFWILFVFIGVPMLGLVRIAQKRDQPRSMALFGILSFLGLVIGALIMLSKPPGPNRLGDRKEDPYHNRYDIR
jgi:hypothetical protein